ncbi:MAG: hypothetical protein JXR03_18120 [Cyclobacteriaceae bacterium]
MTKLFKITSFIIILTLFSCTASYQMGKEIGRNIQLSSKDYIILGPVRLEGKVGTKEVTYDALLSKARSTYRVEDADVVGVKVDKYLNGQNEFIVMNGYAIKYK